MSMLEMTLIKKMSKKINFEQSKKQMLFMYK